MPSLLTPRSSAACLVLDGKIYVIGGYGQGRSSAYEALTTAEVFDPATGKWSEAPALTRVKCLYCAAAVGGKIYAFCASTEYDSQGQELSIEVFDPTQISWQRGPLVPADTGLEMEEFSTAVVSVRGPASA